MNEDSAGPVNEDSADPVNEDLDGEKNLGMNTPANLVQDPLKWLDDGLPDLSGYNNQEFDLAMQFDIWCYVDVLADSVSDPWRTSENREPEPTRHSKLRDTAVNALAPAEEEWGKW